MKRSACIVSRRCFVLVSAAVLAGCATPVRVVEPDLAAFQRVGRFAITAESFGQAPEAVQGGFVWSQSGREQRLDLADPLGNTLARVLIHPGHAVLTQANGATQSASGPDALLENVLGSPMPVSGLAQWLRGRVDAARAHAIERDAQGRPVVFLQDGWRVQLSRYDALGPVLLRLNRNEANRSISVRLVIDPQ